MKKHVTYVLLIFSIFIHSSAVHSGEKETSNPFYWGTWEGTIKGYPGPDLHEKSILDIHLRIVLGESTIKLCLNKTGEWEEAKSGLFKLVDLNTNVLLYSMNSGITEGDLWVETWAINLTKLDDDSVMAYWQRVVNHPEKELGEDNKYFAQASSGILIRK